MDNNNNNKPRKKVTKEILRRRQLCALAVIALIVLILIILIANACTDKSKEPTDNAVTTTSTTTTTEIVTEPITEPVTEPITEPVTTLPQIDLELSAQVQLDKREMTLAVGETDMSYINGYPEGCGEENEIWTTSDPNIATVNEWGSVEAINAGECYIILKFNNRPEIEVQIKVTVTGGEETAEPTEPEAIPENPVASIPDIQQNQNGGNESAGSQELQGLQDVQNYQNNQGATSPQGFPDVQNVNPEQNPQ